LVWRAAPSPTTQRGAKEAADTHATDVMEADLWAAARAGATEVMSLWRGWRSAGVLTRAPSLRSAEYLISQARADLALEILEAIDDNIRGQQLRALAYSRTGQEEASLKLLEKLRKSGAADAETMGLLAGRCKRLWAADGRRLWLEKAHELYGAAFERFGESYTGINAAALALYLGQRERSQRLARDVLAVLTAQPERSLDHWKIATMAEAWHLLGDVDKAAARYTEAVRMCPEFYSDIASMRTQARRNAQYLGGDEHQFDDILAIPRVVAFIGHMEDLPDRGNPRFPPALAAPLREAIRARLRDLSAGFGFCSLARGADILFVEEMLARRSQLKAFLPFPAAEFEKTSVGPRWAPRFRELLAEPRVEVRVLAPAMPPEDERAAAYYACSTAFFRRAIDFAQSLGEKPVLLAVWDRRPGDAAGGTADGVMFWQQTGNAVSLIDIAALRSAHGV
jgi:tetratricopeptide (TPR) repeat protein